MTAIDARTPPPGSSGQSATGDLTSASADTVLLAASGENFSVAPVVLPAATRRHLEALYSYARLVDDIGDTAEGDRLAVLDALASDLDRVWSGNPSYPVLKALVPTVHSCDLDPEPFHRLIDANRQDQRVTRYETFDDLLRYCTLSADPVGRMVLGVFGLSTPDRIALSDKVCTALQLAEHCQDVAEDFGRGRIYLPREDMAAFGVSEADLAQPTASPAVRNLMAFEVGRAHTILDQGAPLVGLVNGRLRLAIAGFVGGGRAALDAIRRAGYDVLPGPPKAPKARIARFAAAAAVRSYTPAARRATRGASKPEAQ